MDKQQGPALAQGAIFSILWQTIMEKYEKVYM